MWERVEEDEVDSKKLGFYMVCRKAKLISDNSKEQSNYKPCKWQAGWWYVGEWK